MCRKLNGTKLWNEAEKATSLMQPGSRTADVAATFTSHAIGRRGERVVEIFAMDVDDDPV